MTLEVWQKKIKEPEPKKEVKPRISEEWLEKNFRNERTKSVYRNALEAFLNSVYPNVEYNISNIDEGLSVYFHEQRNFIDDFKAMIRWMENKFVPSTINSYVTRLKKFFSRHGYKIDDEQWEFICRSLLPSAVVATQDEILTKEQLRAILNHLPIQHKALVLFLVSTGCRVGETLQLKINDLHLDDEPPSVTVRPEYTKKGVGGRIVWMSYEARDTIKEWLKVKDSKKKPGGHGDYSEPLIFPFSYNSVRPTWKKALKEAGLGQVDLKTHYNIYHLHTLRKFFRTQMGLAGVPDLIVHAWMGHKAYLSEAYDRPKQQLAKIYKDHMGAVSVYLHTVEREIHQIIVSNKEVAEYLNRGWRFITKLDDDKVIMEGKAGQIIPKGEKAKVEVKEPEPKPSPETYTESSLTKSEAVTPTQTPSKPPISDDYKKYKRDMEEGQERKPPILSTLKPQYFTCSYKNQALRFQDLPCIKDAMFRCPNKVCEKQVLELMGIK